MSGDPDNKGKIKSGSDWQSFSAGVFSPKKIKVGPNPAKEKDTTVSTPKSNWPYR